MRRSARTVLCGGRSAMVVPTATTENLLNGWFAAKKQLTLWSDVNDKRSCHSYFIRAGSPRTTWRIVG
jgi:hypothetical protein